MKKFWIKFLQAKIVGSEKNKNQQLFEKLYEKKKIKKILKYIRTFAIIVFYSDYFISNSTYLFVPKIVKFNAVNLSICMLTLTSNVKVL